MLNISFCPRFDSYCVANIVVLQRLYCYCISSTNKTVVNKKKRKQTHSNTTIEQTNNVEQNGCSGSNLKVAIKTTRIAPGPSCLLNIAFVFECVIAIVLLTLLCCYAGYIANR